MKDNCIQYIEFYAVDLEEIKKFYTSILAGRLQTTAQATQPFQTAALKVALKK